MQSDLLTLNPKKAVIISKYHSPGISYEQVCRYPLKRGAIVEILCEKSAPFVARVCFDVDPVFGKILWTEICVSVNFSAGLSSWLFYQWQKAVTQAEDRSCETFQLHLGRTCSVFIVKEKERNFSRHCKIHVQINIQRETCLCLEPDLSWSKRLLVVLVEFMQMQDAMAWLSTLGGAYSAMGEHIYRYSEKAGQISQQQLLVAMRLGNPILAAQCKVFAALSLIQQGKLKMASRIIREQYKLAGANGYAKDEKLIASCQAAWSRIQFLQKQKRAKNQSNVP